ncbi:MAG: phage tail tape measure protein [Actinomycetota bacterium]|nr:phage tail tape measure protein [Actinomycetota bacterium]
MAMKEVGSEAEHMGAATDKSTSKTSGGMQKMAGIGKSAGLLIGGSMIAVGVESVKMAGEMQESDAKIAGNAQIPIKAAAAIGDAFLHTAGNMTFSGKEMADAFAPVAGVVQKLAGHTLTAADSLKLMTTATDLAEASGQPLASTTSNLVSTMQAYQIGLGGADEASNTLFNTSRLTGIGLDTLTGSLNKMHMKLGAAAPSLADTGALVDDLASHGVAGSRGMLAVSSGMTTLLGGSKTTNSELAKLGVNVFDSSGKFIGMSNVLKELSPKLAGMSDKQRQAAESALFGKGAASTLNGTILAGAGAFGKAAIAVSQHDAVQKAAAVNSNTLGGNTKKLKAAFSDFVTLLGEKLVPILTSVLGWLMKHKPVLIALGILVGGALVAAFAAWAVELWASAAGMLALMSPVALIVAGVLLLAAGVYFAYKHFKPFREAIQDVWKVMKTLYNDILKPVVQFFMNNWKTALMIAVAIFAPFVALPLAVVKYWKPISKFFTGLWDDVVKAFKDALGFVKKLWSDTWDAVKAVYDKVIKPIFDFVKGLFTDAKKFIKLELDGIKQIWHDLWSGIGDAASAAMGGVKSALNDVIGVLNLGIDAINFLLLGVNTLTHSVSDLWSWTGIPSIPPIPDIPHIPYLAAGGIVRARPGGTIVKAGEAGHDEAVIPLPKNFLNNAVGGGFGGGSSSGGGGGQMIEATFNIILDGKQIQQSVERHQLQAGNRRGVQRTYQAVHK